MSDDPEARKDWRIGVLMADGSTSYEVIHDETEERALREAVRLAARYHGRAGTNPPIRIASVQTFEEVVVSEEDRGPTTSVQYERAFDEPRSGGTLKPWLVAFVLGFVLLALMLGAVRVAHVLGYEAPSPPPAVHHAAPPLHPLTI